MKFTTPLLQPIKSFMPEIDSQAGRFIQVWCMRCANVKKISSNLLRSDSCLILDAAKTYHDTSPNYPKEWQLDKDNKPICTGFELPKIVNEISIDLSAMKTERDLLDESPVVNERRVA